MTRYLVKKNNRVIAFIDQSIVEREATEYDNLFWWKVVEWDEILKLDG